MTVDVVSDNDEVIIEILDDSGAAGLVTEFNTGDFDLEVTTGSTFAEETAIATDVVEVSTGIPGEGAGFQIVESDTPPADTTVLWLDTSP